LGINLSILTEVLVTSLLVKCHSFFRLLPRNIRLFLRMIAYLSALLAWD
jgi:hypothetical protein